MGEVLFIHWTLSPQFQIRYSSSKSCCYTEFVCKELLDSCAKQYWTVLPLLSTVWTWPGTYLLDIPWKPNLFFLVYHPKIGQTCILLVLRQLVWDTCRGYCLVVMCVQHQVRHDKELTSGIEVIQAIPLNCRPILTPICFIVEVITGVYNFRARPLPVQILQLNSYISTVWCFLSLMLQFVNNKRAAHMMGTHVFSSADITVAKKHCKFPYFRFRQFSLQDRCRCYCRHRRRPFALL